MRFVEIDTVILCGGQGKRLRSVLSDTPKVLANINGKPFLDIVLQHLKGQGLRRIILCTGYKADAIEQYYRQHRQGMTFEFSRETEALGTGGALKNARPLILSDPFFVLNGDSFCPVDMNALMVFHQTNSARVSIVVSHAPEGKTDAFGTVTLDQKARIAYFLEKGSEQKGDYVNAGIYCLGKDVWALLPNSARFSLEYDFFPAVLADKRVYGFLAKDSFCDIGTPERYALAKQKFQSP